MGREDEFVRLAEADLKVSKLLLDTTNDELTQNIAAYHTQQAVEKILKAMLIELGQAPGIGHNIATLVKEIENAGGSAPEWIREDAYDISQWATTIRYNSRFKSNRELIQKINGLVENMIK